MGGSPMGPVVLPGCLDACRAQDEQRRRCWSRETISPRRALCGRRRGVQLVRMGAISYGWWWPPREVALWCLSDLALVHCMMWGRAPTQHMAATDFNNPMDTRF